MSKRLLHELGHSLSYGRLSLKAKVLWPMLLATSDDQGRGLAQCDAIKWYVCPNVPEIALDDVPALLAEMAEQEMIAVYDTDRGQVYQVIRWWEYQQLQWARPSKYPPPDGWQDRIRYSNRGAYFTDGWETTGGFGVEPPREPPRKPEDTEVDGQSNLNQPNSTQPKDHAPEAHADAPIPLPKKAKRPIAVDVFRQNAHRFPAKAWFDTIGDIVGEEEASLARWGKTVFAWVGLGWKPTNVKGMLDCYQKGEIPGGDRKTGPPGDNGADPVPKPPNVIRGINRDPEYLMDVPDG